MLGTRLVSWNTMAMPWWWASSGVLKLTSRPSSSMCPELSVTTPASTLDSVDLPAPFSPSKACTSPRRRLKSTSSIAGTPAYFFVAWRSSSTTSDVAVLGAFMLHSPGWLRGAV